MLILTRKTDESIIIGNSIEVKVLKVQGNQVHIGIDAPKELSVYRQEIYDQIRKENVNAVRKTDENLKQLEDNLSSLRNAFMGKSDAAEDDKDVEDDNHQQ